MFKVRRTFNHSIIRTVFAVQQLENGLTQFLLFDEYSQKWLWMPASEYEPIVNEPTSEIKSMGTKTVRRN